MRAETQQCAHVNTSPAQLHEKTAGVLSRASHLHGDSFVHPLACSLSPFERFPEAFSSRWARHLVSVHTPPSRYRSKARSLESIIRSTRRRGTMIPSVMLMMCTWSRSWCFFVYTERMVVYNDFFVCVCVVLEWEWSQCRSAIARHELFSFSSRTRGAGGRMMLSKYTTLTIAL